MNAAGEGPLSNERSATPLDPAVRDISGSVLGAGGSPLPGIPVRACVGSACLDTTSDANGGYAFVDIAPGAYVVRALPGDPALLAAQTTADVTGQSLRGVDLRLATSGSGGSDAGRAPSASRAARAGRCTTSRPPTASRSAAAT